MNDVPSDSKEAGPAEELAQRIAAGQGQLRLLPDLTLGLLHKLNNVMTSIYFTAEGCEADIEPNHPVREMLADLTRAVRDAQRLISQTADVNLSLGSTEVEYHDLNALLKQDLPLVKILLPKSAIVEIEPAPEPVVVRISIADFRRVLFSLAGNARDAASERPRITLRVSDVPQLAGEEYEPAMPQSVAGMVALSFIDNGHGMNEPTAERALEPFYTTREERVGIGLFHAQQTAKNNGGFLVIRRNVPSGSEVMWVLPKVTE